MRKSSSASAIFEMDDDGLPLEDGRALFWRVASSIAAQEAAYAASPWNVDSLSLAFYQMMTDWRFLPNSPTLMNAGSPLGQLSACFVLPVGDSIEEIFDAVKYAAMIHKSGGGTCFSFSVCVPRIPGRVHRRRRFRSCLLFAHLQYGDRTNQAGRNPTRREHGHSARRPP